MAEWCNWSYRGEGNSSLVIANLQERTVLRLRKCFIDSSTEKQEAIRRDWVACKDFIDNIMRPLLGESFVASPKLVELTPDFVSEINREFFSIRPSKRLHSHADKNILIGMVLPDACLLPAPVQNNPNPTFCVELKCKQGFLPPYSVDKSRPHRVACRFCMLQQLKVKKGSLNHLSKFCPLDMFSGNPERMKHALCDVLETPQNNIKVFKDGSLIFSCQDGNPSSLAHLQHLVHELQSLLGEENPSDMETVENCIKSNAVSIMNDVIVKALLHVPPNTASGQQGDFVMTEECSASSFHSISGELKGCLPAGCVLHAIMAAQHLDTSGVYNIYKDYSRLTSYREDNPQHREYLTVDGPYPPDYLNNTSQRLDSRNHLMSKKPRDPPNHQIDRKEERLQSHASESRNHLTSTPTGSTIPDDVYKSLTRVREFMVAGTSKDLSIMVAFQKLPTDARLPSENVVSSFGGKFQHSVKIVDLDPKPSTRIPRYVPLEDDIWANYKYGDG